MNKIHHVAWDRHHEMALPLSVRDLTLRMPSNE